MELTKSQKSAVDQRNCSLLVSAGAGSGKTAVLTQRIINRLCDKNDDCNVTDFLVVTFTTAAAKELSDRIRKKLSDAAIKDPSNKKILRNIALLPQANISTINAFCYDVVCKNFQKLGLNAAVRIADDAEIQVIREKIMNRTLSDAFESEDKDFSDRLVNVSEMFSGARDDENFVGLLLGLDAHLRADTDPEKTKQRVLSMYDNVRTAKDFFQSEYGRFLKNYSQNLLSEQLNTLVKYITGTNAGLSGDVSRLNFAKLICQLTGRDTDPDTSAYSGHIQYFTDSGSSEDLITEVSHEHDYVLDTDGNEYWI